MSESIAICNIRRDGGTQPRSKIDGDTVKEYAEDMKRGVNFPPIKVVFDGTDYWVYDGFHRLAAAELNRNSLIVADVTQGTQRDAVKLSLGVNATHGQRRTNDDKRRAVMVCLNDEEWGQLSDRWISHVCEVSHTFVASMRKESTGNGCQLRKGMDGKERRLPSQSEDSATDTSILKDDGDSQPPVPRSLSAKQRDEIESLFIAGSRIPDIAKRFKFDSEKIKDMLQRRMKDLRLVERFNRCRDVWSSTKLTDQKHRVDALEVYYSDYCERERLRVVLNEYCITEVGKRDSDINSTLLKTEFDQLLRSILNEIPSLVDRSNPEASAVFDIASQLLNMRRVIDLVVSDVERLKRLSSEKSEGTE